MIRADVIRDSVNPSNIRLTTFELEYPRFIHPQVLTHRVFSRNAASSRAIPVNRLVKAVEEANVEPVFWGKNQRGMEAEVELDKESILEAREIWDEARDYAMHLAKDMNELGAHKQIVNRILEPFATIRVVLSGTDFSNFFRLRLHHAAQPEIQALANFMKESYDASTPERIDSEEWHLPYLREEEEDLDVEIRRYISAARCARVSYYSYNTNKISEWREDYNLAIRLDKMGHYSPFEHPAMAISTPARIGNFRGWMQLRYLIDDKSLE